MAGGTRSGDAGRTPAASSALDRLRADSPGETETSLVLATLRIRVPSDLWTGAFTSRHRTARVEILGRTELSEHTSISDVWISGHPAGVWAEEISGYPDVSRVESLAEVGDGCLYRISYRNPPIVYAYRRLRLPIQYPLRIQNGVITWEVIGRRSEFEEVMRFVRGRRLEVTIASIRRRPLRSHLPLLTPAQHELLTQAMAAGYFAVPRGITLTDFARSVGRSKSAVSEALAHIEQKLLESAVRPPGLVP